MDLDVRRAPDPLLSAVCPPADPTEPAVIALAEAMVVLMRASPGCVGIAAPQVGHGVSLFVLDVTGARRVNSCAGLVVLCNPLVEEDWLPQTRYVEGQETFVHKH